jgi:SAM-dependent methyltransferase
MASGETMVSPDAPTLGAGLACTLRYAWRSDDPAEVAGTLHTLIPARARVLDVGCGAGAVALVANRGKDNEVWGIEPDPERAAVAGGPRRLLPERLRRPAGAGGAAPVRLSARDQGATSNSVGPV